MKARKIKRLRGKIAKNGYFLSRYKDLAEQVKRWERFYYFRCNAYFVGRELEEYNKQIYEANAPRVERKAAWYKKRLDLMKSDLYRRAPIV